MKRYRSLLLRALAVLAAVAAAYAVVGMVALPYYAERRLPDFAARMGLEASVENVAVDPFLLQVRIEGIDVNTGDGAPLLRAAALQADLDAAGLWRRRWIVERLELHDARVTVVETAQGLNVSGLLPGEKHAQKDDTGSMPPVVVEDLALEGVTLAYVDRTRESPAQFALGPLSLEARHLSTLPGEQGEYRLQAALPGDGSLSASGKLALQPLASTGEIRLSGFRLATLVPAALDPPGYSAPAGELDASLKYALDNGDEARLAVSDLEATLTDFAVTRAGATDPVVAFAALTLHDAEADLAARSLTLGKIVLSEALVDAAVDEQGNLNLARLAQAFVPLEDETPAAGEPWHVSVGRARAEDIAVFFSDRSRAAPLYAHGTLASLALSGRVVVGGGEFEARLDDGRALVHEAVVSAATKREPLLQLASLDVNGASIDTRDRRARADTIALQGGAVNAVPGIAAGTQAQRQRTGLERTQAAVAPSLTPRARPVAYAQNRARQEDGAPSPAPWKIAVDDLRVNSVAVTYADRGEPLPLRLGVKSLDAGMRLELTAGASSVEAQVSNLGATLAQVRAAPVDAAQPALAAEKIAVEHGAVDTRRRTVAAQSLALHGLSGALSRDAGGELHVGSSGGTDVRAPRAKSRRKAASATSQPWQVRIAALAADAAGLRYTDRALPVPLTLAAAAARLQLALDVEIGGATPAVSASDVDLVLDRLRASALGAEAEAELAELVVENGRFDTARNVVAAHRLALQAPSLLLTRTEAGLSIGGVPLSSWDDAESGGSNAKWRHELDKLEVRNGKVAYADRTFEPAIAYDVALDATLSGMESGASAPVSFQATAAAQRGGKLSAEGTLAQDLSDAAAQLRLDDLPLAPLGGIVKRHAAVDLASGTASADVRLRYARRSDAPLVAVRGAFSIDHVLLNEAAGQTRVLQWRRLDAKDALLTVSPNGFEADEMRLAGPEAQLIVSEKRTLNMAGLLKEEDAKPGAQAQSPADGAAAVPAEERFPVRIGRLSIGEGMLEFADHSLVLPFSTRVHALRGVIVGLSTGPGTRAALELQGEIADYGAASAHGSVEVTAPTRFTDITAQFDNVRLPPLSPYTATFAGRKIESGRMWLDLDYRIIDRKLAGENEIVLQNLELGERVEAPAAMDLPLELAVGLLEDRKGRIRMEIPVSGNVGDPSFDYGAVIRKAIRNAVAKIVTAPFRALASLLGGRQAENVQMVQFEPGSPRLTPSEQQQLDLLAQALKGRPRLGLVVRGPYDPERDAKVLREEEVRRAIAGALGRRTPAGRAPADPVAYSDPRTQAVLENMLKARMSRQEYERFLAAHPQDNRERYEAAFEALVRRTDVPETDLRVLAAQRARAIAQQLAKEGVDASRIVSSQLHAARDSATPSVEARLEVQALASRR